MLVPPAEWGPDAGPARAQVWGPMREARLLTQHLRDDARSEVTNTTIAANAQAEAREAEEVHGGLRAWSWPPAEPRVARQVQRVRAASSQRAATSCPPGIRTGPEAMSAPVEAREVPPRVIRAGGSPLGVPRWPRIVPGSPPDLEWVCLLLRRTNLRPARLSPRALTPTRCEGARRGG